MVFDLSSCVGFVTSNATKKISEDFNSRLEKKGSTRIQWIALYFLYTNDILMNQKELASLMNIHDPSLARLMDRMERDELIVRVENPEDKRSKLLQLTEQGRVKIEALMGDGEEFSQLLLENVTDEELKTFNSVLEKMLVNIGRK